MEEYKVQSSWTKYCDVPNKAISKCINKAGEMIRLGLTIRLREGRTLVKYTRMREIYHELKPILYDILVSYSNSNFSIKITKLQEMRFVC